MPRPFTAAQQQQNRAFLRLLARTGNVRQTCEALGVHRAMFTRRRAKNPAFAAEWDAALAVAHARLRAPMRGCFNRLNERRILAMTVSRSNDRV